ncbi:MAG: glycine oxidase ThiO [Acidobacteriota bacterium]
MASRDADVIVIGGGVIGCAVAFELADAGMRVRVVEGRVAGGGATQASAGVLAPYLEGHDSPVLRDLGRRSLDLYEGLIARATTASGRAVEFARCGTLEMAVTAADVHRLTSSHQTLRAEGVPCEWIEGPALRGLEPAVRADLLGALRIGDHAVVNVPALTAALAGAAAARGADLLTGVAATSLAAAGDGVAVQTSAGPLRAAQVVLAAGAWAAALSPPGAEAVPVRPVRGQLLYLSAPPGTLRHVIWAHDVYLVPWRDGTVLVGATSEDVGFDERATAGGVAGLLGAALALVPALAAATFIEAKRGLRPGSPDDLPYIGRSAVLPGLVYACGHYRNGALLAPLTAALVCQVVQGDGSDRALPTLTPSRAGRL